MFKNLSMEALGYNVAFDQACELARANGFDGVLLDLDYLSSLGKPSVAAQWFAETGLKAGGFFLRVAWREEESERSFEDSLRQLEADAQLAEAIGCKRCVTTVPPTSDTLDFYQHFDLVVPRLIRAADILASHGIMLGFEFVGPQTLRTNRHKDFVHSLDGARAFAASIGMHSLNTGVSLDSFHWYTSGGSTNEIEHLDHHEVVYVRLNDAVAALAAEDQLDTDREIVGSTGVIDTDGFLSALRLIGYEGPVTAGPSRQLTELRSPDRAVALASAALDRVLMRPHDRD
jgi:sugar phosphate isomerase/epimerase